MIFLALSPILILAFLLLLVRWPLIKAAPTTLLYTIGLGAWLWQLNVAGLLAALGKGIFLSVDIALIIFGAMLFLRYLREIGSLQAIQKTLGLLSPDPRLQGVMIAWLFGGFIEGVAGFGTPAIIVAPLLIGIGFKPLVAIVMALLANSTAVAFGAAGTPVRIGFAALATENVSFMTSLISLVPGLLVPIMILWVVAQSEFSPEKRLGAFVEALPWSLFAGFAFLIPMLVVSRFGPEFPSIVGGLIGLALAILSLRYGFLLPKTSPGKDKFNSTINWRIFLISFAPYGLLIGSLLLGKLFLNISLVELKLGAGVKHSLLLFNPGWAFVLSVLVMTLVQRSHRVSFACLIYSTTRPLVKTAVSIFFVSSFTYVLIVSGILESLAEIMLTPVLPLYSGFIGALGSLLAGSATVSNLLFAVVQAKAAEEIGFTVSGILALQLVGAAAGNMLALPNLLAVQGAVGMEGRETILIKKLWLPCFIYLVTASLTGVFIIWLLPSG